MRVYAFALIVLGLAIESAQGQAVLPPNMRKPVSMPTMPPAYPVLAHDLSNRFSFDPALAPFTPTEELSERTFEANLKELHLAKHPVILAAMAEIRSGIENATKERSGVRQMVKDVSKKADDAASQTKIVEEEGPNGRITRREVAGNPDGAFGYGLLAASAKMNAADLSRDLAQKALEKARLDAWSVLFPLLDDGLKNAPLKSNLVTVTVSKSSPGFPAKPSFLIINTSGETLTGVTVRLDCVHFLTTPQVSSREVVFVPDWPAGKAIYLSNKLMKNLPTKGYGRPINFDPSWPQNQRDPHDPSAGNEAWLAGLGGLIETRTTVWANEARQSETSVIMPDSAAAAARYELDGAYRMAWSNIETYHRNLTREHGTNRATSRGRAVIQAPAKAAQPKKPAGESKERPRDETSWELATAKRVLSFLPADSDLAKEAGELLADPDLYVKNRHQRESDDLQAALAPGTRYVSWWVRHVDYRSKWGADSAPKVLRDLEDTQGKLALVLDERGTKQHAITGQLYDPGDPKNTRQVTVEIVSKPFAISPQVFLKIPKANGKALANNADLDSVPMALELVLKGKGFAGFVKRDLPPIAQPTHRAPSQKPPKQGDIGRRQIDFHEYAEGTSYSFVFVAAGPDVPGPQPAAHAPVKKPAK